MKNVSKKLIGISLALLMVLNFVPLNASATSSYVVNFSAQTGHSMQIDGGHLKIDGQYVDLKDGETTIGVAACESTTSCSITVTNGPAGKLSYNTNAFTLYNTNGHIAYNMTDTISSNTVYFVEDYASSGSGGGEGGPVPISGGTLVSSSFTYTNTSTDGSDPADIWANQTPIGVGESPNGDHEYYKSSNNTVTFKFATFVNNRLTSININGTDYTSSLPTTKAGWLEANENQTDAVYVDVPYSATYTITTSTTRNFEWSIGNFLWSNDCDPNDDNYINHGAIRFVSLSWNNNTYNSLTALRNANKNYLYFDELDAGETDGAAVLPAGSVLTVKLLPDKNYQLTSFTCNGQSFAPQDEIGTYTFTVPAGNFHWGAKFTKVDDVVNTKTAKVESGSITLGNESSMAIGTARLDVSDAVDLSPDQQNKIKNTAQGYTVTDYLDVSLYNTVYKATSTASWDTQVSDLETPATITVKLKDKLKGNDAVMVHEKHDGTTELLDAEYDEENNTLTYKAPGFSNYAIAVRTIDKKVTTKNPKTGDNISLYFATLALSLIGLLVNGKYVYKVVRK